MKYLDFWALFAIGTKITPANHQASVRANVYIEVPRLKYITNVYDRLMHLAWESQSQNIYL